MKIYGIDFTSKPTRAKPITCAEASLQHGVLSIQALDELVSFDEFDGLLSIEGPWVAGMDFPFGQSRRFISNMEWPEDWDEYIALVSAMDRGEFVHLLEAYKADRPYGDKEHKRVIDQRAGSISPQKLYGIPVGKMFFEGAPRLLKSPASIIPMRKNNDTRVVVEAYPSVIARRFIERRPYKNDTPAKQTEELRAARIALLAALQSPAFIEVYGFELLLPAKLGKVCGEDSTGDRLDAILCCIQASWAWLRREQDYGVPAEVDAAEGWIPDPLFAAADGR
jgi:hypothetical protein